MKSYVLVLICGLALAACNRSHRTTDSATNKGDVNITADTSASVAATEAWGKSKVDDFVLKMGSSGLMEVQLGKMTGQMATSPQVRDFGQKMVTDHSDASEKLKQVAQNMQLNIPTTLLKEHQEIINKLHQQKGKQFDKEYIKEIIDAHKKDIEDLEKANQGITDPQLKNWINTTLPVLRKHLENAENIQKSIKNN